MTPSSEQELKYKLLLNMVPNVGPVRMNSLLTYFGSAEKIFSATINELKSVEDIGEEIAKDIIETRKELKKVDEEINLCEKNKIKILTIDSIDYPSQLKNTSDPPIVLYVKGKLLENDINSIAIVGTRRPTPYGKEATKFIAENLAKLEITIISGLARGIDSEAHKAALKSSGRTIAVLGNGLLIHYPPENRRLEEEIINKGGAIISEFPLKTPPEKGNFPRRNRIIAGMSLGVVVIEADEKSGALITAKLALEQGKEVFAVPGSIFSKYSKGTHKLIKQGAKLTEDVDDVISEIAPLKEFLLKRKREVKKEEKTLELLNEEERKILTALQENPQGLHIDKIQQLMDLPFGKLSELLLSLEIRGFIHSLPGKFYMKL